MKVERRKFFKLKRSGEKRIQEIGTYVDNRQSRSTVQIVGILREKTQRKRTE